MSAPKDFHGETRGIFSQLDSSIIKHTFSSTLEEEAHHKDLQAGH